MTTSTIEYIGKAVTGDVPRKVLQLAEALVKVHGCCHITREKNGYHINIPSPYCLMKNGKDELWKRHLAVNAEKYLGLGVFKGKKSDYASKCMKSRRVYPVSDLLEMVPIEQRGFQIGRRTIRAQGNVEFMVEDEHGVKISEPPGRVTPVIDLPDDHPAIFYLKARNFDPQRLWEHFQVSWCYEEMPEDPKKGRFYRRLPGGFKDTPQGRLVFYAIQGGSALGWQARYLDIKENGVWWYWHPYDEKWTAVKYLNPQTEKWEFYPKFRGRDDFVFDLSKYRTCRGVSRGSMLMGFDAAVKWNADRPPEKRVAGIVEGPLDAARAGPPFMPVLGKSFSDEQARFVAAEFSKVVVVGDSDTSGSELVDYVIARMRPHGLPVVSPRVPDGFHDLGEMDDRNARLFLDPYLK